MPEHDEDRETVPVDDREEVRDEDRDDRDEGRNRLLAALTGRPSRGQLLVAVLLAAVGFAAMTQVQSNESDDRYAGLRQADLIRVIEGLSAGSERAENDIERLRDTREELRSSSSRREAALEQARSDAEVYGILAGTIPVQGPGIRITIEDPNGTVRSSTLLDIIQELRAAGAEAMEFNDRVRVVAQTAISETSLGIELDGQLIEAPYTIDVIGEPRTLSGALDFPDGPIESVAEDSGSLESEELDNVIIESVVDSADADFASPGTE